MACWHRLGVRCECGHLIVPAHFYWETEDGKQVEVSHEEAEAAYLISLKGVDPALWEKLRSVAPRGKSGRKATCEEPSGKKPHATNPPGRLGRRKGGARLGGSGDGRSA